MTKFSKRILFLDIDGVMNSYWSMMNIGHSFPADDYNDPEDPHLDPKFIPRALEILHKLVHEDKFSIVISSTWRHFVPLEIFPKLLQLPAKSIKGITPNLTSRFSIRGEEIDRWFLENSGNFHPNCTVIILDDSDDFTDEQLKENFVQTKFGSSLNNKKTDGLNWWHYKKIKKLIKQQEEKHVRGK